MGTAVDAAKIITVINCNGLKLRIAVTDCNYKLLLWISMGCNDLNDSSTFTAARTGKYYSIGNMVFRLELQDSV